MGSAYFLVYPVPFSSYLSAYAVLLSVYLSVYAVFFSSYLSTYSAFEGDGLTLEDGDRLNERLGESDMLADREKEVEREAEALGDRLIDNDGVKL